MINRSLYLSTLGALLGLCMGLTSCGSAQTTPIKMQSASQTLKASTYQKPGASIDLTFEAPKSLAVGEYGVLKIIIKDYYDGGTAQFEARPEEGLRFVSETGRKDINLSTQEDVVWELDIVGSRDGVFNVNVAAMVDLPDGRKTGRGYSGRVVIGDPSKARIDPNKGINGTLSRDGKTIKMQAQEVIK